MTSILSTSKSELISMKSETRETWWLMMQPPDSPVEKLTANCGGKHMDFREPLQLQPFQDRATPETASWKLKQRATVLANFEKILFNHNQNQETCRKISFQDNFHLLKLLLSAKKAETEDFGNASSSSTPASNTWDSARLLKKVTDQAGFRLSGRTCSSSVVLSPNFSNANQVPSTDWMNGFNTFLKISPKSNANYRAIILGDTNVLPIKGSSTTAQQRQNLVLLLCLQDIIRANANLEFVQAITQLISIVFTVRIIIVGTLIVQIKKWQECLSEYFSEANKRFEQFSSVQQQQQQHTVVSMAEFGGEMNAYNFAQGQGQGGDEMFGGDEDQAFFPEDDMFGMGGGDHDDFMDEVPDFDDDNSDLDEDDLVLGGGFNAFGSDRDHIRRVPTFGEIPPVGNFYEDEECGDQLGAEFPNAPLIDFDELEVILAEVNQAPDDPDPVAPPILANQLAMEDIFLDAEAAFAA